VDYLIDTHVMLWWLTDNPRLNGNSREILSKKPVWCSVVSLWEIMIKEQIGKITIPETFMSDIKGYGFIWLDVDFKHVECLRSLPVVHKDPFDRILVSQALTEELVLITADSTLRKYNVPILQAD
jgi:PIN domain nuclease of toxin-antitoxin system